MENRDGPVNGPALELESFLPYRFHVLAELLSRSLASIYQDRFGISVAEWRILATLGRESPLSAGEVGRRTHMEKPRVSRALGRMQEAGLLVRRVDHHDHRVAVLRLSRRGEDLYRRIAPLALEWEQQLLTELDGHDRARLDHLLDHLLNRLETMNRAA